MSANALSVIAGLLSGLLFGAATPASKYALSHLNGFQLAGLLYLGSALAFAPYMARHARREFGAIFGRRNVKSVLGIVVFGGMLGPVFLMLGLATARSTSVSVWLNAELIATAVIGSLVFRERIGRNVAIGIVLTLAAGVLVACQEKQGGILPGFFILCACACWGMDNQLTALLGGVTPQATTFIKGAIGGAVNLALGTILQPAPPIFRHAVIALLLGVVSYGVSIYLYVTAARVLGATRSQILFSAAPFWGMLGAFLFLHEPAGWPTFTATAFLVAGIAFSTSSGHSHSHVHARLTHAHLHTHGDGHHDHAHTGMDSRLPHSHEHTHEPSVHSHRHGEDTHHLHDHPD